MTKDFIRYVALNLIPNCPITAQDIKNAEFVWGPELGCLKGNIWHFNDRYFNFDELIANFDSLIRTWSFVSNKSSWVNNSTSKIDINIKIIKRYGDKLEKIENLYQKLPRK